MNSRWLPAVLWLTEEAKDLAQKAAERAKEAAEKMDQVKCEPAGGPDGNGEEAQGQHMQGYQWVKYG